MKETDTQRLDRVIKTLRAMVSEHDDCCTECSLVYELEDFVTKLEGEIK